MKIDRSWYIKPPGLAEHISCGGVVVRRDDDQLLVALVTEPGFAEYILPRVILNPRRAWSRPPGVRFAEESGFTELDVDQGSWDDRAAELSEIFLGHYALFSFYYQPG